MTRPGEVKVNTTAGMIEGMEQDGLYVFLGIPYAAPPVGERRWLPPQPPEAWSGVRPAHSFGAIAPQNLGELDTLKEFHVAEPQSEDCLYLNVWTPGLDDGHRPVFFWIHGDGFTIGSGSQPVYRGGTLARRGNAVVVTINYRLGLLGFLNLNEITGGKIPATGNEGLLDQVAALKWVRDNISAFGGDPNKVTIFGESAGGMSVGALMALPQARGLFHRAILQSGAASTALTLTQAVKVAELALEILGLSASDIDTLRSLEVERLLAAQQELALRALTSDLGITMPLEPVIDGKVLPQLPLEAIRGGSASDIPVVVGTTLDEWKLFSAADSTLNQMDEATLLSRLQRLIPAEYVPGLIQTYRSARSQRGAPTTPGELFMAIQTDRAFRIPAIRLAEAQQHHGQAAYHYLFTWPSPLFGGRLGACHAIELGFLFGTYEENFSGTGPAADRVARNIQDAWLAFAHTGDPSCESVGVWPAYGERRLTMMLGERCFVEEAPFEPERRAWDSIPERAVGII